MIELAEDQRNALTPAEYWEWRQTMSDIEIAKLKHTNAMLELKVLSREAELLATRMALFKSVQIENAKTAVTNSMTEYERYKKVLEGRLGTSLNNKMIDEFTFEVKDVPDTKPNIGEVNGSN